MFYPIFIEIATPVFIALAAFLWYRRGCLWKFYYSLLDDTITQFSTCKINREAWEIIAKQKYDYIVRGNFSALFQFEMEYLRWFILENKYMFWKSHRRESSKKVLNNNHIIANKIVYEKFTNEKSYCEYMIGKTFYWKINWFGTYLFFASIYWIVFSKNRNTGVEKSIVWKIELTNTFL